MRTKKTARRKEGDMERNRQEKSTAITVEQRISGASKQTKGAGNNGEPTVIRVERPEFLRDAPGNLIWKEGDKINNALGAASIAVIATHMLRAAVNTPGYLTLEQISETRDFLEFLGSAEDVYRYVRGLHKLNNGKDSGSKFGDLFGEDDNAASGANTESSMA